MRIGLLHAAASNISIFDAAVAVLGQMAVAMHHHVRADLFSEAQQYGLTPSIVAAVKSDLRHLRAEADAVVLTCSTLGSIAHHLQDARVIRADAALAEASATQAANGELTVLVAVESTIASTTALFTQAAALTGARVTVRLVEGAWARFQAGDSAGYHALVAAEADRCTGIVALGQASMDGAAALCRRPVLTSPAIALRAAIRAAQ